MGKDELVSDETAGGPDTQQLAAELLATFHESTDEEVALWLRERTTNFGESGKVLAIAYDLPLRDAYARLHATETWRASKARFHIVARDGAVGSLFNPDGHTYGVGDLLRLPVTDESPHVAAPHGVTLWRVVAVEPDETPGFQAQLVVEPADMEQPQ